MKKGVRRYRCRACGKTRKEEIPLIGHTYRISRVEPSCIREGYTVQTCIVCGYSLKTEKKSALGHDYQETRVSPTIQSGGYVRHTCRRCGDTFTSDHATPQIAPQAVQNEDPGVIQPALSSTISAPLIASPGRIESTDVIVISKAPVLKNVKRKGKSNIVITWKKNRKVEKKIKGYEIQVCENSAFTGEVCLYRMKRGKYKKTIKGKRKRTYFIRIRYYCQEGNSAWSSVKKVRLR